jgi:hypothetical protein
MPKVLYEKRGEIAYITLNRPDKRNAIDTETDDLLFEAWSDPRRRTCASPSTGRAGVLQTPTCPRTSTAGRGWRVSAAASGRGFVAAPVGCTALKPIIGAQRVGHRRRHRLALAYDIRRGGNISSASSRGAAALVTAGSYGWSTPAVARDGIGLMGEPITASGLGVPPGQSCVGPVDVHRRGHRGQIPTPGVGRGRPETILEVVGNRWMTSYACRLPVQLPTMGSLNRRA